MDKLDAILEVIGVQKRTTEDRISDTLSEVRTNLQHYKSQDLENLILALTSHPKEASLILHEIERGSMEAVVTRFTGMVAVPKATKTIKKEEKSLADAFPIPQEPGDDEFLEEEEEEEEETKTESDDDEVLEEDHDFDDDLDLPDDDEE